MRIYFVLCFALVAFTQTQLGLAGPPGPRGRSGALGPKGDPPPYCRVSSKITDFLKQFRSTSLKGASGKKGSAGSTSSLNYKWIYNCLHAGINFQQRIFEVPVYECCQQCELPDFSDCMRRYSGAVAQCNSEALRCIARCINNKGPTAGQPGPPGPPGPRKCPVKRKKVLGGSDCLERSCVKI
ncbi:Hypothetical predicted protein [Paramuricea clavata]|uniref:Uncharacterized protein n=1 Tax=Paramuricea clavata TaxID=317549 RepID=A0A7D9K9H5_PARCT|nr:Hypothetical predicted protein [Paramuricea clavata]